MFRLEPRGAWVRFYPTFLFLVAIAQRALAVGVPADSPALVAPKAAGTSASQDNGKQATEGGSRAGRPPRDSAWRSPLLSVIAPADAQQVVAYFPFGLVERLRWDAFRQRWSARIVVPKTVSDGRYDVRVKVELADGALEWRQVAFELAAGAPALAVTADELALPGEPFHLVVDPLEPVRDVTAYVVASGHKRRATLRLDTETGMYSGDLVIPANLDRDQLTIRVVARDLTRKRVEQDVVVPMLTPPDCCEDDEETCRL